MTTDPLPADVREGLITINEHPGPYTWIAAQLLAKYPTPRLYPSNAVVVVETRGTSPVPHVDSFVLKRCRDGLWRCGEPDCVFCPYKDDDVSRLNARQLYPAVAK